VTSPWHKVGAKRAAAAVLALDTPRANYQIVWALSKNFPHVKTFVRAHDVEHGLNLEKAGAPAVSCFYLNSLLSFACQWRFADVTSFFLNRPSLFDGLQCSPS
jgi:hypothetical protein